MESLMMCINRGCGWFGPASQATDESEFPDQWLPRCPTCRATVAYVPPDLADAWRVREAVRAWLMELWDEAGRIGEWGPEAEQAERLMVMLGLDPDYLYREREVLDAILHPAD